jgi:hypothetical protein
MTPIRIRICPENIFLTVKPLSDSLMGLLSGNPIMDGEKEKRSPRDLPFESLI